MVLPIIGFVMSIAAPAAAVAGVGALIRTVIGAVDSGLQSQYGAGLHQNFFTLSESEAKKIGVEETEWSVAWNDTEIGRFERLYANLQMGFILESDMAEMKRMLEEGATRWEKYFGDLEPEIAA